MKPREENIDDKFIGRHFEINFDPDNLCYFLKDLGHGFGTFIKIDGFVEIKNNFLLNIGENYLVFTIGLEEDLTTSEIYDKVAKEEIKYVLNIKIFSGNVKHGVVSFTPAKSPLKIGRNSDCEILIDDNLLSRFHCTVLFKEYKWFIQDGITTPDNIHKKSTNGSWMYAYDETPIKDKTTFKANHNLFVCSFFD